MVGVVRGRRIGIRARSGRPVIAVAVMHEDMHERTGEKNDEGQHAKQMRAVLRQKIEERRGRESPEHDLGDHPSASVIRGCHVRIPCRSSVRNTLRRSVLDVYA